MDGPEHRWFRQALTPVFSPAAVARHIPLIDEVVRRRLALWPKAGTIGLYNEMRLITFAVTASVVLGERRPREVQRLGRLFREILLWRQGPPATVPVMRARLAEAVGPIVRARAEAPRDDMLSQVVRSGGPGAAPLSDDQLLDHANTLVLAGHFTAAGLSAYTLLLLADQPDWLARVRDEQAALEPSGMEALARMPTLDHVLMEAERLIAPLPHLPRLIVEDMEFQGHRLAAGEQLLCSVAGTHRDGTIFAEPDRFDPDRFAPPRNERRRAPLALAGFNVGPRRCLGALLAQVMMKVIVHHVVLGFTLAPRKEAYAPSMSLPIRHPLNEMPVDVRARH
jgi:cytochrome P450